MRVSLATKIFLGFMALLGVFSLLAYVSVRELREVSMDLRTVADGHLAVARQLSRLETLEQNRLRNLERVLSAPDPRTRALLLTVAQRYYPEPVRHTAESILKVSEQQAQLAERGRGAAAKERRVFFLDVVDKIRRIQSLHQQLDGVTASLAADLGKAELSERALADAQRRFRVLSTQMKRARGRLDQAIAQATEHAVRRTAARERSAVWRVLITTGVGLSVGLFLTFLAATQLSPINRLVRYARALSRGDYAQKIEVRGDSELASLADELRLMAGALNDREQELDQQAKELERAYRRVEELKRYHERIVRSLRTAVLVTDRQLRITSANPAAEHFGLKALRGQQLSALPFGAQLEAALGDLSEPLSEDAPRHAAALEIGEQLADVTLAPLKSEDGATLGLVLALEDVTEAVRTKEALIRSERLAAIGRMSAHVTHEIRNPLSSIGLNTELLGDLSCRLHGEAEDEEEVQSLCTAIGREVDRLTSITGDYLKFARLPQPVLRACAVEPLLSAIVSFLSRDCEAAKVKLSLEVEPGLPELPLDKDQIRQALLNLLRNGKEAMPEGGPLSLSAKREGDRLEIQVKDAGGGIPTEDLGRIFDPFYSTKLTGTGLGLPLTQQIVTEHGGTLTVDSGAEGSKFTLSLPLRGTLSPLRETPVIEEEA